MNALLRNKSEYCSLDIFGLCDYTFIVSRLTIPLPTEKKGLPHD
jgi:hypothetical protein